MGLCLNRKTLETVVLEDNFGTLPDIVITVVDVGAGRAELKIDADRSWNIRRGELPPKDTTCTSPA